MGEKSLVLDGAKIVRSTNLYSSGKYQKNSKNIKFDLQRYFNMKIIFNSLDRPYGLTNSRYRRESHKILYFREAS
jgi:hypothetical protein